MKRIAVAVLFLAGIVGMACETGVEPRRAEDPVDVVARVSHAGEEVLIQRVCDGPHLIYVAMGYRRGSIAVVPNGCQK